MSTDKNINVTNLLGYKLKITQHKLRLHMDEELKKLGLTTPSYAVLAQLELEEEVSQNGISNAELARRSFITAQTMHGIISNLEQRKLITRKNNPNHGRILNTKLTDQGKEIVQQAHRIILHIEKKMTAQMNDSQKEVLEKLLANCLENLK